MAGNRQIEHFHPGFRRREVARLVRRDEQRAEMDLVEPARLAAALG